MSRRRLALLLSGCVLLTGGIDSPVLLADGAQAGSCTTPTACTLTGTTTVTAGSLVLTVPSTLTWASTALTGFDLHLADVSTGDQAYTVDDATGSGAGWHVTVSATQFTTGSITLPNGGTLSTDASATNIADSADKPFPACSTSQTTTCVLPTNTTTYPVAITTGAAAVTIYDTAINTGMGAINVGYPGLPVGWWVNLLASTKPGVYASTLSLTVISAP